MSLSWTEIHENRRVLKTDKNTYTIKLDRETALWDVSPAEGVLPKALSGRYTTPRDAGIAIEYYIASKERKI